METNESESCIESLNMLAKQYAIQHDIVEMFESRVQPTPEVLASINVRSMDRCNGVVARMVSRNTASGEEEMTINELLMEAMGALAKDLQGRIESAFALARSSDPRQLTFDALAEKPDND